MIIHHNDHIVVDTTTNVRMKLPAIDAWKLYDKLNMEATDVVK
jgi:hypothetical protein